MHYTDQPDQRNQHIENLLKMPFTKHLSELRKRLGYSLFSVFLMFLLGINFSEELIVILKYPLQFTSPENTLELSYISVTEPFVCSLKVALLFSIVLVSPIWIFQLWKFIAPGLFVIEKKIFAILFGLSVVLFWVGIVFCFLIALPLSLNFLINWGDNLAEFELTLANYLSFFVSLTLGFGIIFELPLIILSLGYFEIISLEDLKKIRRYIIVGCLVIASVLTPPDWVSQLAMAIPLYVLFELSILASRFIEKKRDCSQNSGN